MLVTIVTRVRAVASPLPIDTPPVLTVPRNRDIARCRNGHARIRDKEVRACARATTGGNVDGEREDLGLACATICLDGGEGTDCVGTGGVVQGH